MNERESALRSRRFSRFAHRYSWGTSALFALGYLLASLGRAPLLFEPPGALLIPAFMVLNIAIIGWGTPGALQPYRSYGRIVKATAGRVKAARWAIYTGWAFFALNMVAAYVFRGETDEENGPWLGRAGMSLMLGFSVYGIVAFGLGLRAVFGGPPSRWTDFCESDELDDGTPQEGSQNHPAISAAPSGTADRNGST
jgi:hypothetical protein